MQNYQIIERTLFLTRRHGEHKVTQRSFKAILCEAPCSLCLCVKKNSILKKYLLIILTSVFSQILLSQQYYYRQYSVEEGLPTSSVFSFMQDSRGYIWVCTGGGGVLMFDGFRFVTYTTENGLTDNVVRTIFEDRSGNIWIGTGGGLVKYDGKVFTSVTNNPELIGAGITKIIQSKDGVIWVGSNNGLFAIQQRDSLLIRHFSIDDNLSSNFIYNILEDSHERLWLSMGGGVNIVEVSKGDSVYLKNVTDPMIPSDFARCTAEMPDGSFLVGTKNGLYSIVQNNDDYSIKASGINLKYPDLNIWDMMVRPDKNVWLATDQEGVLIISGNEEAGKLDKTNGLPTIRVMNLLQDNEGNTWLATLDQGAIVYRDKKFISYGTKQGITGNNALCVYKDNQGKLYIGTEEGLTMFRSEGENLLKVRTYTPMDGLSDQRVGALTWFDNKLYIGAGQVINILDGNNKISAFPLNRELTQQPINYLFADSQKNLWICSGGGYSKYSNGNLYTITQDEGLNHNEVQHVIEDSKGRIWFATLGGLAKAYAGQLTTYAEEDGLTYKKINCLTEDPAGNIWMGTFGGGIFRFDISKDTLQISNIATNKILTSNNINSLLFINDSMAVAGTDKGMDLLILDKDHLIKRDVHYGISDGFTAGENLQNSIIKDKDGFVWLGTRNGVVRYDPRLEVIPDKLPQTTISDVRLFFEKVDWKARNVNTMRWTGLPETLVLTHKENHITFDVTGFFFSNPGDLLFSYFLDPQSKEWTPYSPDREIQLQSLSPGHYTLKVKARNKFGMVGNTAEYSFIIKPPFYKTKWFITSTTLVILIAIFIFFRIREKKLVQEKIKLEKIVQERTREVVAQKDEIERQRDVVTSQKKEITDSINYAERIQHAVLPDDSVLKKAFSDYFIILRPKDIVSGDFYWMSMKNDNIVFTAADCTGHGVPGAFMSMLGVSFLNKIVNEKGITEPSAILNLLRENIISALRQKGAPEDAKDGMDISLCSVDKDCRKLCYSGANNPLYLIRHDDGAPQITEIKADTMPVGVYAEMKDFTLHELELKKGDTLYLFSDGFLDQFGGPEGKKFMKVRFRQMLLDNYGRNMADQKQSYIKALEDWMNYPSEKRHHSGQIDDIILLGVRV